MSFAQIYASFQFLGMNIEIPRSILDFTMSWIGDEQWDRKSFILGMNSTVGNYVLKRVVNGDGTNNARWFPSWLNYRNGSPIIVLRIFRPKS